MCKSQIFFQIFYCYQVPGLVGITRDSMHVFLFCYYSITCNNIGSPGSFPYFRLRAAWRIYGKQNAFLPGITKAMNNLINFIVKIIDVLLEANCYSVENILNINITEWMFFHAVFNPMVNTFRSVKTLANIFL